MSDWTPAIVERLIDLHGQGLSGGGIAHRIGQSRNAIIGKINRLRAELHPGMIEADSKRAPRINRTEQVAEWMAENDGRICDGARALGMAPESFSKAWSRVVRDMGRQAV